MRGEVLMQRQITLRRSEYRQVMVAIERLLRSTVGLVSIEVVWPVLDDWLGRRHGFLFLRVTQLLTGHGCFGKFQRCIGREQDAPVSSLRSLSGECAVWEELRRALLLKVGRNLSLAAVISC